MKLNSKSQQLQELINKKRQQMGPGSKGNFSKTFGMEGRIKAMQGIQRASGRRGN